MARHVQDLIGRRGLKPGDRLPSERQLASKFKIAHTTVRRALAQLVDAGQVERRVGLGTFVSDGKGATREQKKQQTIALAIQESLSTRPIVGYCIQGAREVFSQDDFGIEVLGIGPDGFNDAFLRVLHRRRIEGLLYRGYLGTRDLAALRAARIPFVSLGVDILPNDVPQVALDYDHLLEQLVGQAFRAGHRSTAFIGWRAPQDAVETPRAPSRIGGAYERACRRFQGWDGAHRVAHLPAISEPEPALVDTAAVFDLDPLPTCLIATDDTMAAALMRDLEVRGLRVPHDVSVAALFDNTPLAHRIPLTAASAPIEMPRGYAIAARMLREQMHGRTLSQPHQRHRMMVCMKTSLGPAPQARNTKVAG